MGYGWFDCYNGSYYSDYYIYFKWDGYSWQCDCSSNSYHVYVNVDGVNRDLGWFAGASYTGYGCYTGVGPSRSANAIYYNYE